MLVISRMAGQSMVVGPNCEIEIEVLKVHPRSAELRTLYYAASAGTRPTSVVTNDVRQDEVLDLGYGISCVIVNLRDDKVRLGISAPKEMRVHRKEVWEAIQRECPDECRPGPGLEPESGLAGAGSEKA